MSEEKKEIVVENKIPEQQAVTPEKPELDFLPKNAFGKFLGFLSTKFLHPSVITIFITALLGPIAINMVNDSFENKKLQKEVIQTVLNYTSEADFSKPESIEKIGIISKMVDENQEVFGLTFAETNKVIDMLNNASNDVGIKNLTKKLTEVDENIQDLAAKLNADSTIYADLIVTREKIVVNLDRYKKVNNNDKISEYENMLSKTDLDIKEAINNKNFHSNQFKYWSEQKLILETDIKSASENLSEVLKKNRNNQDLLTKQKDTLKIELAKAWNDINALKNKIQELQTSNKLYMDSLTVVNAKLNLKKK
jgi:hypothetical protein